MGTNALIVLMRVWTLAPTTKSDFAREFADTIAALASSHHLTTEIYPGANQHGRHWKLTPSGASLLWDLAGQNEKFLKAHAFEITPGEPSKNCVD